ncbi:MAG: 3D domain-containing protein [Coriobacteriia bacterium]|nr:3D domain-containing protein [Coriobacteriia bacterium]
MERQPAGPARFLRPQYIVTVLIAAAIIVLSVAGFVGAQKAVTVVVDGESRSVNTQSNTVAALLAEAGIAVGDGDVVNPPLEAELSDGMTVVVRYATPVVLSLQGGDVEVSVVGDTVADALVAAGLDPSCGTVTEPCLDAPLSPGMVVRVSDVFVRVQQEEVEIPFETTAKDDDTMSQGSRSVVTEGAPGKILRVYRVLVTNGVEGPRTLTAEEIVLEPVDEVVAVGTKRASSHLVASRSGSSSSSSAAKSATAPTSGKTMRVATTAYAPGVGGVGWRTATGMKAGYGIAAVDPSVIPLGTRMYVPGYGYALAADTGGAIVGNRVDLCFDTAAEAYAWGRRTVTITILP